MDGKRYIRVLGRPADYDSKLSTGERVKKGKPYWVEVQPIEWLMDKSGWVVAKKCLFAGIQFDEKYLQKSWFPGRRYYKTALYDGDFSKTFMKHYLDTYFAKEMEPFSKERKFNYLVSKAARLDEVSEKAKETLKKQGLIGKALHDAEQKARLKVSKAILKQRQTTR